MPDAQPVLRFLLPALLICACGGVPAAPAAEDSGGAPPNPADGGARGEDGGQPDAAGRDAGELGASDAGASDAGAPDAGGLDAGVPDAGAGLASDAGQPDAGAADAGLDAGVALLDAGLGPDFVIEGFGAATKGGWQPGYDEYLVTSLLDTGPGTLREGLTNPPGPRIIRFAIDGTIALASALLVPSNITIDGRGHDISLANKGLILLGSDDVIILNLAIVDVGPDSEDGLRIGDPAGASERVVVDHVTFRATGSHGDSANVDEAMSVVFGSKDITLSWLRFENWEKVLLIGNGDAPQSVDSAITVSWHHCYFKSTGRRHPQVRFGTVDMWNVFMDDWHMYDWFYLTPYRESFGAQSQEGARVRVEQSFFKRAVHTEDAFSTANEATRCELNGKLDGVGLVTTSDSTAPLVFNSGCTGSTGWVRPYAITLDAADAALRQRLETQAGNTL